MKISRHRLLLGSSIFVALVVGWVVTKAVLRLPSLDSRTVSSSTQDTAATRLGTVIIPRLQAHPDVSGVFPLREGQDAFGARVLLANAAERTLDVQYYIWHHDTSGSVLMDALRRAANRGVRVRLLLDDNNTPGLDPTLSALDAHPNIEVRLFNPFVARKWRVLGYLTDFFRLNRRMHNKSFTADNQATIIGGRNVGDEYFGGDNGREFVDLDLLAIGPVVNDVSRDFDRYWASDSAYPIERIVPPVATAVVRGGEGDDSKLSESPAALAYLKKVEQLPFVREMLEGRLQFEWAPTKMVSDDPGKGLGRALDGEQLWPRLKLILGTPKKEIRLISPYFVPTEAGVDAFVGYAKQGVKITVLTNSLEATDVLAVHAGYAKRRKRLLEAGVTLYELKRSYSGPTATEPTAPGSSSSSLHAKTFSVDGSRVFVGSFNFDPRSSHLNTELGFVIESETLAKAMADVFANRVPIRAYRVQLTANGGLQWVEKASGEEHLFESEPHAGWYQRVLVSTLSWLPIEWLL